MKPDLTEIDGVVINNELFRTKFTCDLKECKGACCTMKSDFGAPVTYEEILEIEKNLENIAEFVPEAHLIKIKQEGFWEAKDGIIMLKSMNKRECVFVYYESDVARCSIEKAYFNKRSDFRKPISCHLFPIRISDFGGPVLRYEKYDECQPALIKGNETKISIIEFCTEALERRFGNKWLLKLKSIIR